MNYAVLLAGGKGERLHNELEKPLVSVLNRPLFSYPLDVFENETLIDYIILVINPEKEEFYRNFINEHHYTKILAIIEGGKTRHLSSKNALNFLKDITSDNDYIIFHDVARALLHQEDLSNFLLTLKEHNALCMASPLKDTIVQVKQNNIETYLNRDVIKIIETPQAFKAKLLFESYKKAKNIDYSDNTKVFLDAGNEVDLIYSKHLNIKITTPSDLELFKAYLGG